MLLLYHANIYTLNPDQPKVNALAMRHGRIIAAGESATLLDEFPSAKLRIDLGGRTVIPGLTDAHIHLAHYAIGLQKVDCETATRAECLARVAERARSLPPQHWILGHGWNQNRWQEGFGSAVLLDDIAPDHPTYLTAKSLHAGWANSLALRRAGIHASTPDPVGGQIGRNPDGSPNGILYESAMDLVDAVVPEPEVHNLAESIAGALAGLARMGITGVHDFDRRRCFAALQVLQRRGDLRQRVLKSIPLEDLAHTAAIGLRSGFGDDFLRIGGVKAFADGALGPRTAAMLQPYEGEPENRGMLLMDAEELFEHGRIAVDNGLALSVHAIGDRANHEVLDGFTQLRAYEKSIEDPGAPTPRLRHRIEHVQLLHPDDVGRLASLGLVASMQPIHATSDMAMADRFWGARAAYAYAWRLQKQHGATLAFGSDAPVESPNPFLGLHAAVTRCALDGSSGPQGWYPQQKLTLSEALIAFTQGPAYLAGMEDRLGRLEIGFLADLLVLDRDPYLCPPEEIATLQPVATMVNGQWLFRDF
jgi:predicted amidohydrolase YtcJ